MLHLTDIKCLPIPAQFFVFAEANIESAEVLCASLCATKVGVTYAHGTVILSLTFHSCELFLKGAILEKKPNEQFSGNTGHNLDHLSKRYANLFPGKKWALDLPFCSDAINLDGLDPRIAEVLKNPLFERERAIPADQFLRYPTDIEGQPWDRLSGFEPNSFLREIARIRREFERLKSEIQSG